MNKQALSLLVTLGALGCGSADGGYDGSTPKEDAGTNEDAFTSDVNETGAEPADASNGDTAADTSMLDASEDADPSSSVALVVRFDGPAAREIPRGTVDADLYRVTLSARQIVELFRFPFSIDQVRESACAFGGEGAPNYTVFALRDAETREILMGPVEVTGIPNGPRGMGEFTRAVPLRLRAGEERTLVITATVRSSDPHCPFLGEGVRVTMGDPVTGRFFAPEAAGLVSESRYVRHGEIGNDLLRTGNVMTIGGPGYDQSVVSSERGQFWFCGDPVPGLPAGEANAYRGCCTNGRWRDLSERDGGIQNGMLLRLASSPTIYYAYTRGDRTPMRTFFPTTAELNSWRHPSGRDHRGLDVSDPTACLDVFQVTSEQLLTLSHGPNAMFRPGSVYVRREAEPTTYAMGPNRTLIPISLREGADLEAWLTATPGLVRRIPEAFFTETYGRIGPPRLLDDTLPADRTLETFTAPMEEIETGLR